MEPEVRVINLTTNRLPVSIYVELSLWPIPDLTPMEANSSSCIRTIRFRKITLSSDRLFQVLKLLIRLLRLQSDLDLLEKTLPRSALLKFSPFKFSKNSSTQTSLRLNQSKAGIFLSPPEIFPLRWK